VKIRCGDAAQSAREARAMLNPKSEMKMGLTGLEPVTLRLSSACSNQLSYRPEKLRESMNQRFSDCRQQNHSITDSLNR
jgi:hypothetical protein